MGMNIWALSPVTSMSYGTCPVHTNVASCLDSFPGSPFFATMNTVGLLLPESLSFFLSQGSSLSWFSQVSEGCFSLSFNDKPFFFLSLSTYEYFSGFCPCLIHLFIYFSLPQRYESCSGPGIRLGIGHLLLTCLPMTSITLTAITVASQRTTQVCFQCWFF